MKATTAGYSDTPLARKLGNEAGTISALSEKPKANGD